MARCSIHSHCTTPFNTRSLASTSRKMAPTHLLYFDGQTQSSGPSLRRLFHREAASPLLKEFLAQSADTLRLESLSRAQDVESKTFPVFQNALDLAGKCDGATHDVVLCTVALYIAQMGDYIL